MNNVNDDKFEIVNVFYPNMGDNIDLALDVAGLWTVPVNIFCMDETINIDDMKEDIKYWLSRDSEGPQLEVITEEHDDDLWRMVFRQGADDEIEGTKEQVVNFWYFHNIDFNDGEWPEQINNINMLINAEGYFDLESLEPMLKERFHRKAEIYVAHSLLDSWEPTVVNEDSEDDFEETLFREETDDMENIYMVGYLNEFWTP